MVEYRSRNTIRMKVIRPKKSQRGMCVRVVVGITGILIRTGKLIRMMATIVSISVNIEAYFWRSLGTCVCVQVV